MGLSGAVGRPRVRGHTRRHSRAWGLGGDRDKAMVSHTPGHGPTGEDEARRVAAPQVTHTRTTTTPEKRPRQEVQKHCTKRRNERGEER